MIKYQIKEIKKEDLQEIYSIFKRIVSFEDSYVFNKDTEKVVSDNYWLGKDIKSFVLKNLTNNEIIGFYKIIANQRDLGSHVANSSFMINPKYQGMGFGRLIGNDALNRAKDLGYKSMQFNFVVSTNIPAVNLWKSLGFKIIGTVPNAFNYKNEKLVDVFIMHKDL